MADLREVMRSTDGEPGANETLSAAHPLSTPRRRGNRYLDVEERLEAQKGFYHEKNMRGWLAEIEAYPDPGYCYFVGSSDGLIKIGHSRDPGRRLSELRRATPEKLQILTAIGGGRGRERYYHILFAEHHRGGEWFDPAPEILAEIERIGSPEMLRIHASFRENHRHTRQWLSGAGKTI